MFNFLLQINFVLPILPTTYALSRLEVGDCSEVLFKIELNLNLDDNLLGYAGVGISMYSNLAETAQELAELSENLKSVSGTVELFNQVISERL